MSKIPFSIEYRPLIESGEYKVEIGREDPWPARIVCWDLNGDNIIAVVMNPEGREEGLIYTKQGKHNAICPRIDSDLFIIIPEPELTESEDERIRKTLVEYFGPSAQLDFIRGVPIQKIRDWLEKQKEQKPHLELKAGKWYICHRAFCARADHLTVKEGERFQCERDGIVKGFVIKEPEKYFKECSAPEPMEKEQKPAEWSKNDIVFLNEITDFFENKTVRLQHDIDMYAHWLKSLPERFNLQPKQEWGEEDEKLIEEVCRCLCEYAGYYKEKDMESVNNRLFKLSQRLKSLRPQPKEQDVEKIQALKAVLENRLNLLHKAIVTSKKNKTHLTTKWLDGKECGYSDVLELLNSRPESIRIEL